MSILLFDIGGTKTRLALSKDGKTISEAVLFATSLDPKRQITNITDATKVLTNGQKITRAIGGVAGPLSNDKKSFVRFANPHTHIALRQWSGLPIASLLSKAVRAPVQLENDAALAGLGECWFGPGKNVPIVAYLTISTGVGGCRFVDGRIDRAASGFEPGHHIINLHDRLAGKRGTLGSYVAGKHFLEVYGRPPETIRSKTIWKDTAKILGLGLVNISLLWSPDMIILGGSMMNDIPLDQVQATLKNNLHYFAQSPRIVKAQLGDANGLYGALVLSRQKS